MTFKEALKKLNIEDYGVRIINSNSHGELFHLGDYVLLAEYLPDELLKDFRIIFLDIVKGAKEQWKRPESIFQHILTVLNNNVKK